MEVSISTLPIPDFSKPRGSTASTRSIRRRDSAIVPDAPITPPMSPGHSEQDEEDAIVVDDVQDSTAAGPATSMLEAPSESMQVDSQASETAAPARPLRDLAAEKVHLTKTGLKLMDFEVRGTVGA